MTLSSDRSQPRWHGERTGPAPAPWELDEFVEPELPAEEPEWEEHEEEADEESQWEAALEEAYRRGYDEGLAEGREEGLATGRTEGRQEGFEEGHLEGRREETKRLGSLIGALEEALFDVRIAEEGRLSQIESNLAALSVAIAREIIGRELRDDADAIADLVRRALVEFPIDQPLRIRLNPQDLSTIAALSQPGGEAIPIAPGRDLRWLADPNLEPGSCIVEGTERVVDGRLDRALERIYRRLVDD